MSSYDRALELVGKLEAGGVPATVDPRSATPPVVLVVPPRRVYDLGCGYTAAWQLIAMVPGLANADAHKQLDELADAVAAVLDVKTMDPISYTLGNDNPPHPAYRIEFSEGLTWP